MPGDVNKQAELANGFRHGLTTLGLSRFTLTSRRNVGEVLLHGGVPINSVGALAKTLARWDETNPSGDAKSFVAWLSGLSQKVAITRGIDVPTWLFITETGEIAADFIDRCLIAIDHVAGATSEDPALPSAVLDEIALALAGADTRRGRGARERRAIDVAPSLVFSAQRVQVRLPPLEAQTESDIQWIVTVDGTSQRVESPAPWPGDPVTPKFVPVRAPARRAVVSVVPSEQAWELDLIDADDPLLVFDYGTQQLIPSRNSLSRGRVWVAFPSESASTAEYLLECEGNFVVLEKASTPSGWDGWEFASIDLSDATRVRLRGSDRWRYVSTTRRPRLIDGSTVPFIETLDGRAVLAEKPLLELPGTGGEATMTWLVSVATSEGEVLSTDDYDVGAGTMTVRLWGSTNESPLGDFIVNVRGPLGRGATLRVAIADGFSAVASTDFRWMRPDGRGLDSAELTIRSGAIEHEELVVSFTAERWRRARTLRAGTNALEISAKLPSMAVGAAGTAFRSRSGGPIPLDLESLVGTTLRVDVPPGTWGAQLGAVASGEFVQAINASQAGGAASFSLAQLSDTLETHRFAQLRLILGDRSVPVAYVRPGQLTSAASVDDGVLALENAMPVEGLMALAYPKYAPWRAPASIQFPPGTVAVALPEEVLREGAATFVVSVANPWVPFEAPALPDWSTRNAFVTEWGEVSEPDDPRERGFRSWLATGSPCPSTPESLPIALKIYTLVPRVAKRIDIDRLRSELAEAVRSNREQVVDAVLRAESDANDLFRLFVEADVVTVPREAWESSDLLWSFSPALGIVADTDEHAGPHRDQLRDNLSKYVGESAIDILDAGTDPYAAVGRFGPRDRVLDSMPQDRIDAMWAIANVLPRGLLDKDTRAQASKLLFDRRRDRSLDAVIAVSRTLITEARTAIATDLGPSATAPLDIRISDDGWMNLPALSLACAFVARTASRGGPACSRTFEKLRKAYMRLADAAPDIVQQDLGLAELWITRWSEQ
ncbi:hypothetical protein ASF40_06320 [Microbacterium sp. Leaf288]|nr:hypothetical protein ASF40_06320 [Microbacterium sp. Leaf288]